MNAAIYARKSTEQSGVSDDQKSVARQVEHARTFAAAKGWGVSDEHIFADDGISGAEFAARPGLMRLLVAIEGKPVPFDVLVMSELSRLGRESVETSYILKRLMQAGVTVWFYLANEPARMDSPIDKLMVALATFGDDIERQKSTQRVSDAMMRKAKSGHVTGGRVFGYDNVEVLGPDGKRSHVERRVNEVEAAVVRRIFELSESGSGLTRITKTLNADHAPSPRPQKGHPAGWSASSVREVLHRELYLGMVVWNRSRKRDQWGQQNQRARPETEWLRVAAPHLRIVPDALWEAAHRRLAGIRAHLETAQGGRFITKRDIDSRHLLSGFARCATCGGTLSVVSRQHGQRRAFFYGCLAYHKRGPEVCANGLVLPVHDVDDAVLQALGGGVLRPEVAMAIVDAVFEALKPTEMQTSMKLQEAELRDNERRIAHLVNCIEEGAALAPLVAQLQARQAERERLQVALAATVARQSVVYDRAGIEKQVLARVAQWRTLLTTQVADGRQLLREVLDGPLRFTPEGRTYRFEGEAATERLLGQVLPPCVASPAGFEPAFQP